MLHSSYAKVLDETRKIIDILLKEYPKQGVRYQVEDLPDEFIVVFTVDYEEKARVTLTRSSGLVVVSMSD